ncbi:hypothetical protein GDO81_025781 [Engystomops pustulosus]|uniref:Uncharacterized protein n=1 Tax=Engystomops pustulosus TaxID=76066 RepID=A0AAV6YSJ3_ENGPU|nr:hypothetical protein GDO81_025781 [Engystomops pustulosus]
MDYCIVPPPIADIGAVEATPLSISYLLLCISTRPLVSHVTLQLSGKGVVSSSCSIKICFASPHCWRDCHQSSDLPSARPYIIYVPIRVPGSFMEAMKCPILSYMVVTKIHHDSQPACRCIQSLLCRFSFFF